MKHKTAFLFTCLLVVGAATLFSFKGEELTLDNAHAQNGEVTSDPVMRTLIAGLKKRETSFVSATGYLVKENYTNSNTEVQQAPDEQVVQNSLKKAATASHMFFAAEAIKMREDEKSIVSPSAYYTLGAYDGEKLRLWNYGSGRATDYVEEDSTSKIAQSVAVLQLALGEGSDKYTLSAELSKRRAKYISKEFLSGIETYKVEADPEPGSNSKDIWWIAPERDFIVLKHEFRSVGPAVGERIAAWRHVETVDNMRKLGGLWLPSETRHIIYLTLKSNPSSEVWASLDRVTLLSATVNAPIPSEIFDLPLPLGTRVGGKGRDIYIVGGDVSEFEERVQKGKPDAKELLDVPLNSPGEKAP